MMRDPLRFLFDDRIPLWIANQIRRGLMRLLRPTPVYIPAHPMSKEERERMSWRTTEENHAPNSEKTTSQM